MASVADVQRSIDFYGLLGLGLCGTHRDPEGTLVWASVKCHSAELMLSRATRPLAAEQGVTLYLYSSDLVRLRERLLAQGVKVSAISYPFFMPKGKMRLQDPDGYTLLIGQSQ